MRVSVEQREFLARVLREICPSGEAFLFGSRVDDGKLPFSDSSPFKRLILAQAVKIST